MNVRRTQEEEQPNKKLWLGILVVVVAFIFGGKISRGVSLVYKYQSPQTILSVEEILQFQQKGHIVLRGIAPNINKYRDSIVEAKKVVALEFHQYALDVMGCPELIPFVKSEGPKVLERCRDIIIKNNSGDPSIPYVQYIHLHKKSPKVFEFASDKKLASIAAQLLQVPSVRLYQTTAFFKPPPSDTLNMPTAWHRDLHMVPLDTNKQLTMWCPLKRTPRENSVLKFATGSHTDISFMHWFPKAIEFENFTKILENRYKIEDYGTYEPGDCSFHHGWTWHAANENKLSTTREAIGVSYVDADAKLLDGNTKPLSREDELSWKDWIDDVYNNGLGLEHPMLPRVYP